MANLKDGQMVRRHNAGEVKLKRFCLSEVNLFIDRLVDLNSDHRGQYPWHKLSSRKQIIRGEPVTLAYTLLKDQAIF